MASPFGSFLKAFIVAFLSIVAARQKDGTLCFDARCIQDIILSAIFALIPVIINWINPHYKGYGEGS
jgi:hypothetical protein